MPPSSSSDTLKDDVVQLVAQLSAEPTLPMLESVAKEDRAVLGVPLIVPAPERVPSSISRPDADGARLLRALPSRWDNSASAARTTEQPEWLGLRTFVCRSPRGVAENADRAESGVRSRSAVAVELVDAPLPEQPE
jgi:hypothetical protein